MQHPFPSTARWIWLAGPRIINQVVAFRRTIRLERVPADVELHLSVDSDYRLSVNGREQPGRHFSDYPRHRTYTSHAIAGDLRPGINVITVLAYYRGESSSEHRAGEPGLLMAAPAIDLVSDGQWRCRQAPEHQAGPMPKVTRQMGFTTCYDARRADAWEAPDYQPGNEWQPARPIAGPTNGFWQSLRPRPLPILTQGELRAAAVIEQGAWQAPDAGETPAERIARGTRRPLPQADTAAPFYLIGDLGGEEVGLLMLDLDAPAGTVIDIAHGEHLEDGHVRAVIGERLFGDRYICRAGRQRYVLPFRRLGCRYLELAICGQASPVTVHAFGLLPVSYPRPPAAPVMVKPQRWQRIDTVALRTLDLCMHEHYEDCPWREQALYAFDSRNQALFGYYGFGEYAFPCESFRLLGWGAGEDGLLELCAPAAVRITIPIFSLSWICAMREHWLFSGNAELWEEFQPIAEGVIGAFLNRRDPETGLGRLFQGERYWTFYEWAPELQTREPEPPDRLDAPHNLFLIEALDAMADMTAWSGREPSRWRALADELRQAVHRTFWDAEACRYLTYFAPARGAWYDTQLTQALARALRLPGQPPLMPAGDSVPMTLSTLPYLARAHLGATYAAQQALYDHCHTLYGGMVDQGATSLWETAEGAADFGGAGSLCHGWSALPVWLLRAMLLGVRPLSPGFERFCVQPHPGACTSASGMVPTPHGPIQVAWQQGKHGLSLDIVPPEGCRRVDPAEL